MVFTSQSCTFQSLHPSQALLSRPVRFLLQSMTTSRLWALSITNLPCPVNQDGIGPPKLLHFLLPSNSSWRLVEFPASPHLWSWGVLISPLLTPTDPKPTHLLPTAHAPPWFSARGDSELLGRRMIKCFVQSHQLRPQTWFHTIKNGSQGKNGGQGLKFSCKLPSFAEVPN